MSQQETPLTRRRDTPGHGRQVRVAPVLVVGLVLARLLIPACAQSQSLYSQSLRASLTRSSRGVELLLLDVRTNEILVNTFPATPMPVGSLLKPFLAVAYSRTHPGALPAFVCQGHPDRCWKPGGHGLLPLSEAIAQSCNAYFLALAAGLGSAGLASIPYLPAPPSSSPSTLIGLTPDWRLSPEVIARAYAALLAAPRDATRGAILAGMRASALRGTAARIGPHRGSVLAKTGTAACVEERCLATGDGLVVAAVPAAHPALLLLVRRRATTGATTAADAGRLLTQIESLHVR